MLSRAEDQSQEMGRWAWPACFRADEGGVGARWGQVNLWALGGHTT